MNLTPLLRPARVAIVGASPTGTPADILANLTTMGFDGEIVLVNPRRSEIAGRPCHPTLAAAGAPVDVAAIALRADRVADALREAVAAGARSAVVFADGFSAVDPGGPERQAEIASIARDAGIPLLGPNVMGYLAPAYRRALYIDIVNRPPAAGTIGLVTQSGSVGVAGINHTGTLALSAMISVGNEAGVTIADAVDFLRTDGVTRAIAIFAEGIADGRALAAAVRRSVAGGVPVVLCKTGRSPAAIDAARSHSSAMANDHAVVRAVMEGAGAAIVEDLDEMFAAAELLATDRPLGRTFAAATLSGGHVGLLEDMAAANGLAFAVPDAARHAAIEATLGARRGVVNPLDSWVNDDVVEAVGRAADAFAAWPEPDAILLAVDTPRDPPTSYISMGRGIAARAVALAAKDPRPVVMVATAVADDDPEIAASLREAGVPRLTSLAATFRAWGAIARAAAAADSVAPEPAPAPAAGTEADAYAWLADLGARVPRHRVCHGAGEAAEAAEAIGFPVVMKVLSPAILHKTEIGGVVLGIADAAGARAAACRLLALPGATGILVAETIGEGVEIFIGARTDPSFGPVVVVGSGGILAELVHDVAVLPAPASPEAVAAALGGLAAGRLLAGFRGAAPVDIGPLARLASRLSHAVAASASVAVDLNPVRIVGGEAVVLDAKIVEAEG
ncbi:acetate--CoA ligase family protein [Acuticoccus kandeliae]|uniref:acetate--CoA ligase family protein n=1 Tax=Acuticoccus kandeliae TaxID=2073160 RepID=UPI0014734990|nr:acetate--CoA ligase family protein [Acuticoccus kandeliae]